MVKKLHYIWLGKNPKSRLIKTCMKSWKKYFPDWEIIEWNESNLDIQANEYVKKAYDEKKYAFASDFFRFDIISKEGGLYLDTDVKVIRPFQDILEANDCVVGFEFNKVTVGPGLILYAKEPHMEFIETMREKYFTIDFVHKDNGMPKTICEHTTEYLCEQGMVANDTLQAVAGVTVFPSTYFCPVNKEWSVQNFSKDTRCIHYYGASWISGKYGLKFTCKRIFFKMIGPHGIRILKAIKNRLRARRGK